MNDLGTIARIRRQELGLTQREVGKKACCGKETVKAFEHNKRSVGLDYVQGIFKALGMKLVVEMELGE